MTEREAKTALKDLSIFLKERFGKKVLILLDEYDTPLQEAYVGGYWDEMAAFIAAQHAVAAARHENFPHPKSIPRPLPLPPSPSPSPSTSVPHCTSTTSSSSSSSPSESVTTSTTTTTPAIEGEIWAHAHIPATSQRLRMLVYDPIVALSNVQDAPVMTVPS